MPTPTIQELSTKFRDADAAGDSASAQVFADEIRRQMAAPVAAPVAAPANLISLPNKKESFNEYKQRLAGESLAGIFQGAVIDPAKAVANALISIYNPEDAERFYEKQQELQAWYNNNFRPSPLGAMAGTMLTPNVASKISIAGPLSRMIAPKAAKQIAYVAKPMLDGAYLGGVNAAASTNPSLPGYWNQVGNTALGGAFINTGFGMAGDALGKSIAGVSRWMTKFRPDKAKAYYLNKLTQDDPEILMRTVNDLLAGKVPYAAPYANASVELPKKHLTSQALAMAKDKTEALIDRFNPFVLDPGRLKAMEREREDIAKNIYGYVREQGNVVTKVPEVLSDINSAISAQLKRGAKAPNGRTSEPINKDIVAALRDLKLDLTYPVPREPTMFTPNPPPARHPATDAEHVQGVIKSLKTRISKAAAGGDRQLAGVLNGYKKTLNEILPNQPEADKVYSEMSKQMDQAKVMGDLQSTLKNTMSKELPERALPFANAIDKWLTTLKRSTGEQRYKSIDELLTPEQMAVVSGTRKELEQDALLAKAAAEGAKAKVKTAVEKSHDISALSRPIHLAHQFLSRGGEKVDEKMQLDLAKKILYDPVAAADDLLGALGSKLSREAYWDFLTKATNISRTAASKVVSKNFYSSSPSSIEDLGKRYSAPADATRASK